MRCKLQARGVRRAGSQAAVSRGGHQLTVDTRTCRGRAVAYWQVRLKPDESLAGKDKPRLVEELTHLLSQAVRRRKMSDVPLGAAARKP